MLSSQRLWRELSSQWSEGSSPTISARDKREKQHYEQQRDAQQQQEARQQELNERRAEALTEIKKLAGVVVEDVRSWAGNTATSLDVEKLPPTNVGFWQRGKTSSLDRQVELLQKYAEIVEQRDHIAAKMETLRSYYWEQKPYLLPTQRSFFESFDNEFDKRYSPLSAQLPAYETVRQRFTEENLTGGERRFVNAVNAYTLGLSRKYDKIIGRTIEEQYFVTNAIKTWEKEWAKIPKAARPARDWDFRDHQHDFDQEIERLTGTTS